MARSMTSRGRGVMALALVVALAGCGGRERATRAPSGTAMASRRAGAGAAGRRALAVNVMADTGRSVSLAAPSALDVRVSLARVAPTHTGVPDPPLPPAEPDTALPARLVAAARSDPASARLEPPVLIRPGTLVVPKTMRRAMTVELEVRVDSAGRVVDVRWAGGDADTALVGAAQRCAAAMQFAPARLGGRAVEVWCRQRFDFGPR